MVPLTASGAISQPISHGPARCRVKTRKNSFAVNILTLPITVLFVHRNADGQSTGIGTTVHRKGCARGCTYAAVDRQQIIAEAPMCQSADATES
jgi:hypothetical protein